MSARQEAVHEHEFEAAHGLPEPLPAGERILWQGSPSFIAMAERCFHVRTLAYYFAAILALRAVFAGSESGSLATAGVAVVWLLPPVVLALAMLTLMAWLSSRTTVYTITDRRVVMRIGIVLSLTFNLPYARIVSANARLKNGVDGDIALALGNDEQIAYVHLWPHARPWKIRRTEPMLRCVPDTAAVAQVLADAWRAAHGLAAVPVVVADAGTAPQEPASLVRPALARSAAAEPLPRRSLGATGLAAR